MLVAGASNGSILPSFLPVTSRQRGSFGRTWDWEAAREPEDGTRTPDGSESGQPDSIVSDRHAQWGDLVFRCGKSRDFLF